MSPQGSKWLVGPDGSEYEFPSDATPDEMNEYLQRKLGRAQPAQRQTYEPPPPGTKDVLTMGQEALTGFGRGAMNTAYGTLHLLNPEALQNRPAWLQPKPGEEFGYAAAETLPWVAGGWGRNVAQKVLPKLGLGMATRGGRTVDALVRAGVEAGTAAATARAQGADPGFMAAVAAAPPLVGRALGETGLPQRLSKRALWNYIRAMHPRGDTELKLAAEGADPYVRERAVIPTINAFDRVNRRKLRELGIERQNLKSTYPTSEYELEMLPVVDEMEKTARMRFGDPATGVVAKGTPEADAFAKVEEQIGNVERRSEAFGKKKGMEVVTSTNPPFTRPTAFRDPNTGQELEPTVLWDSLDDLKTTLQSMGRKGYIDADLLAERGAKQGAKLSADVLMGILDEATPDIAAVNKEMGKHISAGRVLKKAKERALGHDVALGQGPVVGGQEGVLTRIGRSLLYSKALTNTRQLLGSTGFRTLRGSMQLGLADALQRGDFGLAEELSKAAMLGRAREIQANKPLRAGESARRDERPVIRIKAEDLGFGR